MATIVVTMGKSTPMVAIAASNREPIYIWDYDELFHLTGELVKACLEWQRLQERRPNAKG